MPSIGEMRKAISETQLDLKRFFFLLLECLRSGLFPFAHLVPFAKYKRISLGKRVRQTFENLGLTYLKLGQYLALRYDILPQEVCDELNQLFKSVPPMPPHESRSVIETELGGPLDSFFREYADYPIAAASVAQVHRAVTRDGILVAVKIQRTGIEPIFKADIRNLLRLAALVQALGLFGRLSARGLVGEFAEWTLKELNFRVEGETAERIAKMAASYVVIPRVHWQFTTRKVLTMDFIDGVSTAEIGDALAKGDSELMRSRLPNFDLDLSMHRLGEASLTQLFVDGFYHGDPHPGNILFRDDNRVAFLDFGIFGELTDAERKILTGQIERLALGDITGSLRYYSQQLLPTEDTDFDKFRREAQEVLGRWYQSSLNPDSPIGERAVGRFTAEMIEVSRRNSLRYGLNYVLFWRALNNLNGTLWYIAPNYDFMGQLREFFVSIRPGPIDRLVETLLNQQIKGDSVTLCSQTPAHAESILGRFAQAEESRRFAILESMGDSRDRRRRIKAEGLAMMALPAAILLAAPDTPVGLRVIICGVLLLAVALPRGKKN
jgi:ubiquinone biosynthesis protein